jgi:hypothetical protein
MESMELGYGIHGVGIWNPWSWNMESMELEYGIHGVRIWNMESMELEYGIHEARYVTHLVGVEQVH